MLVTLISPYSDITSLGVRCLSAYLRANGVKTRLLFLPHTPPEIKSVRSDELYSKRALEHLVDLASDSVLIGVSLMTNYLNCAVTITQAIKEKLPVPVIWGGIHPTIMPEECLPFADMVSVGESEEALLELVRKMEQRNDISNIRNIWVKSGPGHIENPVRPLIQDLDQLPFPDYDLGDHHVLPEGEDRFLPMDCELLERFMLLGHLSMQDNTPTYQTMASRGCPHRCSYCCNDKLQRLYEGQRSVRRRSVGNLIEELESFRKRYPFTRRIGFSDDSFFITSDKEMQRFADAYKQRVGLDFYCLGSPLTVTEKKMEILVDAGISEIQMGIQTGSSRMARIYNREIPNATILKAARAISKFKDKLKPPIYDLLINNPLESVDDWVATCDLLLKLPRPYNLQMFSLVPFPGTTLYQLLLVKNLITAEEALSLEYHRREKNYRTVVFALFRRLLPRPLLWILSRKIMFRIFSRPFFDRLIEKILSIRKKPGGRKK